MEKAPIYGRMAECIMVITFKIRSRVTEFTCGQMAELTLATGLREFKTISGFTFCQTGKSEKVAGKARTEKSG
jgi:hypothetical protein